MSGDTDDDSVVLFARKTLENNTRIFKQAKTLTEEGYDVTLIGIKPTHLPREEEQEGYTIVRVGKITPDLTRLRNVSKKLIPLYPLYVVLKWFVLHLLSLVRGVKRLVGPLLRRSLSGLRALVPRRLAWAYNVATGLTYRHLRIAKIRWYVKSRLIRLRTRYGSQTRSRIPRRPTGRGRLRRLYVRSRRLLDRGLTRLLQRLLAHGRWFVMSYNYYRKSYRAMKERDLDPDVVQANDLNTLVVAILAARRHDAPLYYDAQELYTEIHTLPGWYSRLLSVQERVLIRFADRVTVVNPFIAEVMEERYGREIDDVILNCPPFDPIEDVDARPGTTAREKFDIDPETPVVLYSGGLSTQRGLENLVKAMADVPDAVLVILGEGPLRNELEAMTLKYDIEERVYFSEFVPHEEVPTFIASADVGVVPYERVGMNHFLCSPSKLFHYMMAELVVVGSAFPFLGHVIEGHDIGGTFDPQDHQSMAEAIGDIVADPGRLDRHRENVAEAKHRYTWEHEAETFLAQYEAVNGKVSGESVSEEEDAQQRRSATAAQ